MEVNQDMQQIVANAFDVIADRVRMYRKKQGLSQTELAELLELTQAEVSLCEAKKRRVTLSVLIKLCLIFGITPNELIQL